jgi:hypothetical protein
MGRPRTPGRRPGLCTRPQALASRNSDRLRVVGPVLGHMGPGSHWTGGGGHGPRGRD